MGTHGRPGIVAAADTILLAAPCIIASKEEEELPTSIACVCEEEIISYSYLVLCDFSSELSG